MGIEDTLKRRGRHLDSHADASGMAELFSDLRVPPEVAGPLFEWYMVLGDMADAQAEPQRSQQATKEAKQKALRYDSFLSSLRRAQTRLRTHLDALYGAILLANIDLSEVLDPCLREPGQMMEL